MDGWDDIDAITADLDNVLSGLDIPGDNGGSSPTPQTKPTPTSFNTMGGGGAPTKRMDSSKKKMPSVPGHASQFSPMASSPPASRPMLAQKPSVGMPAPQKGGMPRPIARGANGMPAMPAANGVPGGVKMPAFGTGSAKLGATSAKAENEYTNQDEPEDVAEEEYNVLDGVSPAGGTPEYGFDDRFGPGSVWFHGKKKRALCEALIKKGPNGTYLVRESTTSRGDYVLSCKESDRMSHYIITSKNGRVTIGDRHFGSIPLLVKNYQTNILETTKLLYPVDYHNDEPRMGDTTMNEKKAKALYNFSGDDDEDLAFSKGDFLTIIDQSEPNWWRARDNKGKIGVIPHNYVEILKEGDVSGPPVPNTARPNARASPTSTRPPGGVDVLPGMQAEFPPGQSPSGPAGARKGATFGVSIRSRTGSMKRMSTAEALSGMDSLKAPGRMQAIPDAADSAAGDGGETAKAIMTCHPNAYDPSALSFKKGDTVVILKKDSSGTWEGEANGRRGHFPCSYVE